MPDTRTGFMAAIVIGDEVVATNGARAWTLTVESITASGRVKAGGKVFHPTGVELVPTQSGQRKKGTLQLVEATDDSRALVTAYRKRKASRRMLARFDDLELSDDVLLDIYPYLVSIRDRINQG